jgi:hypothetical protein
VLRTQRSRLAPRTPNRGSPLTRAGGPESDPAQQLYSQQRTCLPQSHGLHGDTVSGHGISLDEAAERYKRGVEAAGPYMRAARAAAQAISEHNRNVRPATSPCGIKGCKRLGGRRGLCQYHWRQVPERDRMTMMVAVMDAQQKEAAKWYRKFTRELRERLAAAPLPPQ